VANVATLISFMLQLVISFVAPVFFFMLLKVFLDVSISDLQGAYFLEKRIQIKCLLETSPFVAVVIFFFGSCEIGYY
jgi:hypothetical protein